MNWSFLCRKCRNWLSLVDPFHDDRKLVSVVVLPRYCWWPLWFLNATAIWGCELLFLFRVTQERPCGPLWKRHLCKREGQSNCMNRTVSGGVGKDPGGMKLRLADSLMTRSVQVSLKQARSLLIADPPSSLGINIHVRGASSLHNLGLLFVLTSPGNFSFYLCLSAASPHWNTLLNSKNEREYCPPSSEVTRVKAHSPKFNCFWLEKPGKSRIAFDACQPQKLQLNLRRPQQQKCII